jgi:hypothetical protein
MRSPSRTPYQIRSFWFALHGRCHSPDGPSVAFFGAISSLYHNADFGECRLKSPDSITKCHAAFGSIDDPFNHTSLPPNASGGPLCRIDKLSEHAKPPQVTIVPAKTVLMVTPKMVTPKYPRRKKARRWAFNPQLAVNLLFETEVEQFPLQRAVYTFLLLVWILFPNRRKNFHATASSLALRVTFTSTSNIENPNQVVLTARVFQRLEQLEAGLSRPWYRKFYENFVVPIGGLPQASGAVSFKSMDTKRKSMFADCITELALVEYLVKASKHNSALATRGNTIKAFAHDVLGTEKRLNRAVTKRRGSGLKKSTVEKYWDSAPDFSVFLYLARSLAGPLVHKFFSNKTILKRLNQDRAFIEELKEIFTIYEGIICELERVTPGSKAVLRWRMFRCPVVADSAKFDAFDTAQMRRILQVFPHLPNLH